MTTKFQDYTSKTVGEEAILRKLLGEIATQVRARNVILCIFVI